jgi:hypothetical protein
MQEHQTRNDFQLDQARQRRLLPFALQGLSIKPLLGMRLKPGLLLESIDCPFDPYG